MVLVGEGGMGVLLSDDAVADGFERVDAGHNFAVAVEVDVVAEGSVTCARTWDFAKAHRS